MGDFAQGFGFGLATSMFSRFGSFGLGGFGFGNFGFGGFGFGNTVDPIFTCSADLDSRSGLCSWVPGLNQSLQQGYTFPLQMGSLGFWC